MSITDLSLYSAEAFANSQSEEFSPSAYFDKHMDCIRVQTKDASVLEHRINRLFTVLVENYVQEPRVVGFTIKGVNSISDKLGLSASAVISLTELIDKIVSAFPDETMRVATSRIKPILDESELTVDFAEVA